MAGNQQIGFQAPLNKTVTEAVVNTLYTEKVEVPNSQNARAVRLNHARIECAEGEAIAATLTQVMGAVGLGDIKAALDASATLSYATAGVVALVDHRKGCLVGVTTPNLITPRTGSEEVNMSIPRAADGKYYVTVGVVGANNAGVKAARFSMDFTVVM